MKTLPHILLFLLPSAALADDFKLYKTKEESTTVSEYYRNDAKKERHIFKSKEGVIYMIEHFNSKGKKHGMETLFYEDGSKRSEHPYFNGLRHGICRNWTRDGYEWAFEFHHGTGTYVEYLGKGKLSFLAEYVDGKTKGKRLAFDYQGKLLFVSESTDLRYRQIKFEFGKKPSAIVVYTPRGGISVHDEGRGKDAVVKGFVFDSESERKETDAEEVEPLARYSLYKEVSKAEYEKWAKSNDVPPWSANLKDYGPFFQFPKDFFPSGFSIKGYDLLSICQE